MNITGRLWQTIFTFFGVKIKGVDTKQRKVGIFIERNSSSKIMRVE